MIPRLVVAHNRYRSANPSGENIAVAREIALLRDAGVDVRALVRESDALLAASWRARLAAAATLHAPPRAIARLTRELAALDAPLVHAHNLWPMLTYGLMVAAKRLGMATVQTLHNWRLIASERRLIGSAGARAPADALERELCARLPAGYGSRAMEALYVRAIARAWRRGVIARDVDLFVCLSEFQRRLVAAAGVPVDRIVVKPNFVADGPASDAPGGYALFVGRLTPEKGAAELLRAWPATGGLPLRVVGDGPLAAELAATRGVELLGRREGDELRRLMAGARFLVMNSRWHEPFGLVLIEAFAAGTPCLVPALGAMPEIVEHGRTGAVFAPDDDADLAARARALWEEAPAMRAACRAQWRARYAPEANRAALAAIHVAALARAKVTRADAEATPAGFAEALT